MKKTVSYILFFGLTLVLLWLSFRGIKWKDFQEGLRIANYYWIVLSMLFGAYSSWIRGVRWRLLIQGAGYRVGKGGAFDAVNIAYLANFALPRAGEVARCGTLVQTSGIPFDTLLGTVVLERLFDVLCLMVITVLIFVCQWNVFGAFMEQQLWTPFVEAFEGKIIYLILIFLVCSVVVTLIVVYKKRLSKYFVFKKLYDLAAGIIAGVKSSITLQRKASFLLYTLILWVSYWAMSWCTVLSFPQAAHLSALDAMFLMVVGSLGWIVPVQGGIGAYHFIVSLALISVYGMSQTHSIVFATISHESQTLLMITFGVFSLIRVGFQKKRKAVTSLTQALPSR